MNRAARTPAASPHRCPSHDTNPRVGSTPNSSPPYSTSTATATRIGTKPPVEPAPGNQKAEVAEHEPAGANVKVGPADQPHPGPADAHDEQRCDAEGVPDLKHREAPQGQQRNGVAEHVSDPGVQERRQGNADQAARRPG